MHLLLETTISNQIFSFIKEHSATRIAMVRTLCAGMLKVGRIIARKSYKHLINVMALADVGPFYPKLSSDFSIMYPKHHHKNKFIRKNMVCELRSVAALLIINKKD
jgi:hypothetical protein